MKIRLGLLPFIVWTILGALGQGLIGGIVLAQEGVESTRSSPKDDTVYTRPAVPEDYAGGGVQGAVSPSGILIVDAAISAGGGSGTEPSIAVNPANPNQIVLHAGFGGWNGNASVLESTDGGVTWTLQSSIQPPSGVGGTGGCPCDTAIDYGRANLLSGTFLSFSPTDVYSATTSNPASAWNYFGGATTQQTNNAGSSTNADQPWLLVNRDPTTAAQDNVYVAYDDFNNTDTVDGPDMQVAVSYGANPPNFTVDGQTGNSLGSINPGHRLAVDPRTGAVYSLFQRNIGAGDDSSKNIDYMLNRSTNGGATWPLGGGGGIIVANADSDQPTAKFGTVNALLGGVDHAAVDPVTGDVYYVYGDRDPGTNNNRLSIKRVVDDGAGGMTVGAGNFVTGQVQAAIPSVAVTDDRTVGVFYYTFDGFSSGGGFPIFTAHLALSDDFGATFTASTLLTFLSASTDSGNARQRVLGDYVQLKAVGNCFYGVFTGNGAALGGAAQHDPIFYTTCVGPDVRVQGELDFGNVPLTPVGGEIGSKDLEFEVLNVGAENLTVNSVTCAAGNCTDFSVLSNPRRPLTVSPDAHVSFVVRFDPTVAGARTATIRVSSNDPDQPTLDLTANGTGAVPTAQVSPNPLSFGNVPVNPTGGEIGFKDLSLKVRNTGNSNLEVTSIAATGGNAADFTLLTPVPGFPTIISPDAEFDFQIRFDPSALGARTTTIRVTSNSGGVLGTTTDVTAEGNTSGGAGAGAGLISANPSTLDFGLVSSTPSRDATLSVCNGGQVNLSITGITIAGTNAGDFAVNPPVPGFPVTITPDDCHDFTITFTPSEAGTRTAIAQIAHNAGNTPSPLLVNLVGQRSAGPDFIGSWVSLTQTCKGLGPKLKCTLHAKFLVTNHGTGNAAGSKVAFFLSGDNSLEPSDAFLINQGIGQLKPGKASTATWSKTLAAGTSASGKFVFAVLDSKNVVSEINETNNVIVFGPIP